MYLIYIYSKRVLNEIPWQSKCFGSYYQYWVLWDFMKDYENPENSWRIQRYLFRTTCFLKKIHLVPHSMHICSFCCWKPHAPHMQPLLLSPWPSYVAPAGRMAPNVAPTAGQEFPLPSCGPTMFPSIFQTPLVQRLIWILNKFKCSLFIWQLFCAASTSLKRHKVEEQSTFG